MAQSTLSMRVDETLKKKFDMICDDFLFSHTMETMPCIEIVIDGNI